MDSAQVSLVFIFLLPVHTSEARAHLIPSPALSALPLHPRVTVPPPPTTPVPVTSQHYPQSDDLRGFCRPKLCAKSFGGGRNFCYTWICFSSLLHSGAWGGERMTGAEELWGWILKVLKDLPCCWRKAVQGEGGAGGQAEHLETFRPASLPSDLV